MRPSQHTALGLSLAAPLLLVAGCADPPPAPAGGAEVPAEPVDRHVRWSTRVGQGAEPRGDDFARLAAAGYRVVLSVDGKRPDLAAARAQGLDYAHVPIGYDGVDRAEAVAIVRAVRDADGPVYVHCHHGRHRGPAAAALARIAVDGVAPEEAVAGLLETLSPAYPGLQRDVADFRPPDPAELAAAGPTPAVVEPTDMVGHMVEVAERWEHLQFAREQGWAADPEHPDIDPPHQARLLLEAFREAGRLDADTTDFGPVFRAYVDEAEAAAAALEGALRRGDPAAADAAADAVKRSCTACHADFRG